MLGFVPSVKYDQLGEENTRVKGEDRKPILEKHDKRPAVKPFDGRR